MAICRGCQKQLGLIEGMAGICGACLEQNNRDAAASRDKILQSIGVREELSVEASKKLMAAISSIILTTESAHDLQIAERLEIITAECVLGMNIFQDIGSALRDLVGGRNETFQVKLREARKTVLAELKREAHQLGADAVVAVSLAYSEISGGGKSMLFLVASGTAVRLAKQPVAA